MTSPVTQVAEVAVNRDVRNPADRPLREDAGRESSSVPAAMIPRNAKAMIRLILTDRRNFRGSLRRVNKRMIFLFLIRHIMNSTCKIIHPKPR
jgi:hypothetical protein